MSQKNVELLRWVAAVANEGDIEAMDTVAETVYHSDATAHDLQPGPGMPELMEGRAAVVAVWRQWMEVLDEWRIEIHEIVDADPWVVSDVQWFAKGKGSEVTIDWRVTEAHRFKDGKIACSIFGYPDVAAALEAIESSEQDAHADS